MDYWPRRITHNIFSYLDQVDDVLGAIRYDYEQQAPIRTPGIVSYWSRHGDQYDNATKLQLYYQLLIYAAYFKSYKNTMAIIKSSRLFAQIKM